MKDAMQVRFSILMPVYNREKYVRQAIDSVLSQPFTDHELLVVDDGSTDGSAEVLESYGSRIRLIRQRNQGPEVARNRALALARGEYLVLLDSDDFLFPFALVIYDRIIRTFDSPPVIVGSMLYYGDGEPLPAQAASPVEVLRYRDYLSKDVPIGVINSQMIIRKSLVDEVGGFRNSTPQTFHDDDLHLMLMVGTRGPCIVIQKPYTVAYRQHEGNSIRNVGAIADGVLRLARAERRGQYPGGRKRRSDRYALIGGRSSTWAFRYCWRGGQRKLALRLLAGTTPMVVAALWKRLLRYMRKPTQPTVLREE
jgi:glycosyltransferase involved in cell wall biosynthesis